MSYAADHAGALTDVQNAGAPVSFTRTTQSIDPLTEQPNTPAVAVVSGFAIRRAGNPRQYEALKLTDKEAVTLLFAASNYGDVPVLDAVALWAGKNYIVRSVNPIAPDGIALLSNVIIST